MVKFSTFGDASALLSERSDDGRRRAIPAVQHLFASIANSAFSPSSSSSTNPIQSIKERRTGVVFEAEYCSRSGQRNCPRITGTGTRIKKVAGIKSLDVYALALYVDEQQTKTALSRFSSQPRERIANDPTLFPELMKADWVEKSLVLVITSGLVKRRNFLEALEERLKPPLIQKRQEPVLESFRNLFDTVEFKKGLQISFTFCGNKTLKTRAGGKDLGILSNPELSSTLLDIYLGSNPVSPQAKNAFANGLASMISKN